MINNQILAVVLGFLFIGSAAAIVSMSRPAAVTERTPGCVIQEPDGETFVYGAYA
jgi:hypothetical protein